MQRVLRAGARGVKVQGVRFGPSLERDMAQGAAVGRDAAGAGRQTPRPLLPLLAVEALERSGGLGGGVFLALGKQRKQARADGIVLRGQTAQPAGRNLQIAQIAAM